MANGRVDALNVLRDRGLLGGVDGAGNIAVSGLTLTVASFAVAGFKFDGGTITALPSGTWYVGVELSSKQLRLLPRLGHRGWIPVGRIEATAGAVTSIFAIPPAMPASRIPRTLAKVLAGQPISVVVMGSSLTQSGGAATDWAGMVFGAGTVDKYKLPVTVSAKYTGVGASPNMYQLAQCGFASSDSNYGYPGSGFPGALLLKSPPNGRSTLFSGVDLVVLGCLANGGDYRLDCIEPIVRKLRAAGVEVLLVTDNPQGPSLQYSSMSTTSLYVDGPAVMRVADLYGVELADTAAYVFEAHLRASGVGIYSDTIHQASGVPIGPESVLPANGHEAWARAVRSIFSVQVTTVAGSTNPGPTRNFDDGTVGGVVNYSAATVSNVAGALVITKNTAGNSQWGANLYLGVASLNVGDTVTVTGTASNSGYGTPTLGVAAGSWASNSAVINGAFSLTFTVNRVAATPTLLFFGNFDAAANGANFTIDNIAVSITTGAVSTGADTAPARLGETRALPPIRVVTDFKTPADAFVILPQDELYTTSNNANKGALAAHPWGAASFARLFSASVGAATDMLVLATGKKAVLSGTAVVGLSIVHYRDITDAGCTFDVMINGALNKSMTIGTVPFGNEWYMTIFTPTELAAASPMGAAANSIELVVTSGTLKLAALVALTADVSYLLPEEITYVGAWLPKENSRSSLPGRPTDTVGAYALAKCTGRRVAWIVSANPGSKMADVFSDRELTAGVAVSGNYHIRTVGGLFGPGANHMIRCAEVNAAGDQANGHALHVGGAIVINDR